MMRDSDDSETVEMIVIAQIPDLEEGDDVLISALNWRLSLTAAGSLIPDLGDVFIFRLSIPVHSVFQFNLYTHRRPSSPTQEEDDTTTGGNPLPVDRDLRALSIFQSVAVDAMQQAASFPLSATEGNREEEVGGAVKRNQLRLNRAEWYGHLVVATPHWKTVFISWGDVLSNWMKSPAASGSAQQQQLPLLMMVRCHKDQVKQRLRLRLLKLRSYDQDDDDDDDYRKDAEEDGGGGGGGARELSSSEKEFPFGSGCYWIRGPIEIAKKPSRFPVEVTDQSNRKSVHHQLHVTWSEHPVGGESNFETCIVCCELHPVVVPVPVPRLSTRATPLPHPHQSVEDRLTVEPSSV